MWLTTAFVLATLALWPASALADVEVLNEETEEHCPAVTIVEHEVDGGCHVEYRSQGHFTVILYTPALVVVFMCEMHFEAQIGEDGGGYVTEAQLTTEAGGTTPPCGREPCDEANHEMIPWPIQITESAGVRTAEIEICLRLATSSEGTPSTGCRLHLPLTHHTSHAHEIGGHVERFCENIPVIGIRDLHLVPETAPQEGTEDIYLAPQPGQVTIYEEGGGVCPGVRRLENHEVEGGCHVEYASTHPFTFVAYMPNPTSLYQCNWHLEARVDGNGAGYVTSTVFSSTGSPPCNVPPCMESSTMIPWPLQIREGGPSNEAIELEACLGSSWCNFDFPLSHNGGHSFEVGSNDEYFCTGYPGLTFSFDDVHLANEEPPASSTEDVEIVH